MTDAHDLVYRDVEVLLPALAATDDVIRGVTFDNCTLVGPAVVVLLGTGTLAGNTFEGPDASALFWPLGDRRYVIGAIGLMDCTITGCTFRRVGLAIAADDADRIRAGFLPS